MGKQLDSVRYDIDTIAHSDVRRTIYQPEKIMNGVEGFVWHNAMTLSSDGLELGKHFHDYQEFFFTPTGVFEVRLVDMEDMVTKKYTLTPGSRILIPENIGHIFTGRTGNVLMAWGNAPFDPKRLIPCSVQALEALALMKN